MITLNRIAVFGIAVAACLLSTAGNELAAQSLAGTYVNESNGETLTISDVDASTADLKVSMKSEGNILTGVGKFRYFDGTDSTRTGIMFTAGTAGGNATWFESWSGHCTSKDGFAKITVLGVRTVISKDGKTTLCTLGGPFVRKK